jgi:cytochrome c-type biogenesis protein CcmH/NrfG
MDAIKQGVEPQRQEKYQAVQEHPEQPDTWINLGSTLTGTEHYVEALQAVEQALKLNPQSPSGVGYASRTLNNHPRPEEVLAACVRVIMYDPSLAFARV